MATSAPSSRPEPQPHSLPPLPYAADALEPTISARTLGLHHGHHHRCYVEALNELVRGTPYAQMPLPAIIADTAGRADRAELYRNAAQHWNHSFQWRSLKPQGGGEPPPALRRLIEDSFGSVATCTAALAAVAAAHFGSGWAWLVLEGDRLRVLTTADADLPSSSGTKALLAIDLWEHAYYLDHQHRRAAYVAAVLERLIDWDFAARNAADR